MLKAASIILMTQHGDAVRSQWINHQVAQLALQQGGNSTKVQPGSNSIDF
jgi:hypothetical protein